MLFEKGNTTMEITSAHVGRDARIKQHKRTSTAVATILNRGDDRTIKVQDVRSGVMAWIPEEWIVEVL